MIGLKHAPLILGTLAAVIFFGLWRVEVGHGELQKAEIARLDEQLEIATLEINQCISDKAISERSSNDYQKSINSLRRQLNSLRDDPTCVPTESSIPSNGHNGAATGAIVSGRSGLRTGYIIDLGGRAEETRLKLIGCQSFINELYKSRGYND